MGFLSKKTVTCEKCGKEYELRIDIGRHLCPDCKAEEQRAAAEERDRMEQKKANVRGYVEYAERYGWPKYTEEQLDQIAQHRDGILEKYRRMDGISRAELQEASDHYKKLTDEQAADVLIRMSRSSVSSTLGAVYSGYFFVLTDFTGVIVDSEDVFAVGFTTNYRLESTKSEVILCAAFTNDPYIPVLPLVYLGKLGFFEIMKSKKGRAGVAELFETICPNLTYPVQDLKKLKKQIKSEGTVKGDIDQKQMLDFISDAEYSSRIFDTKQMYSDLDSSTETMLDKYGYIPEYQIDKILKMDKMFNRNYWKKQIKRLSNYDIGDN